MKSSKVDLKRRGFIDETDIEDYLNLSYQDLLIMIKSTSAHERTIAVKLLSNYVVPLEEEVSDILLMALTKEKSLYTKIEICKVLESCGALAVRKMVMYLGKIGDNQHRRLPHDISKKSSYPLPRDIIARTLGKMSINIIHVMIENLDKSDSNTVREVIDAIGYRCFYNDIFNKELVIGELLRCLDTYISYDIIRWKIVMAFSSFQDKDVINRLEGISKTDNIELIRNEAKRSLSLINKHI